MIEVHEENHVLSLVWRGMEEVMLSEWVVMRVVVEVVEVMNLMVEVI